MAKQRNKTFLVLMFFGILLMAAIVFWSVQQTKVGILEPTSQAAEIIPIDFNKTTKIEIEAPDGKCRLTMETKKIENSLTQTFFILNDKHSTPIEIYSAKFTSNDFISVPYNSFSPDNKYIFLKEEKSDGDYFVLRTDGENIRDGKKTVKIIEFFKHVYPDFKVTDVTGWGGINLIILNTSTQDGNLGPSFWFDLSNLSFIKLGTEFN